MFYSQTVFPESRGFQCFRYGTGILVGFFYLGYLAYLLIQIVNDEPLIQTSYEYVDKLSIPDTEICGVWSDIEISRCVFTWDDWSLTTSDGCNALYYSNRIKDNTFCYLYAGNDTYFYGNSEAKLKGPWIRNIDFYFKIKNVTEITSRFLSVGTIAVQLMDPEFDPLWRINSTIPADVRIKQEFQLVNGFAGIQNMTTQVAFKKITLRTILPGDLTAIIGGNPNYHGTPYLTSISKDYPLHQNESFTDTGHFNIAPGSFIHEVKSEKRSRTVFGVLGLAGGAFGLIVGIYIMLFGRPRSNPWGIMHRFAKLEITNRADLQNLPFISEINSTQDEKISAEQRVIRLEDRIRELETILGDYVFNPSVLKRQTGNKNFMY